MAKRLLARVKLLRESLGLSQEAFAEKAGLAYKYYQHVEAGRKRDIRLSTLQKLAKACGLELWELLNLDAMPTAVAEDVGDSRYRTTPRKPASKPPRKSSVDK